MRTRNTAFSLVVVLLLLCLLVLVVQQNPQSADWTLFGQAFPLNAGVAVASAMLIGFLLAALFVLPFVVPTETAASAAETTIQTERDLMDSRDHYRQLQAEHSRLQTAYNQLVAERDRTQVQPASSTATPSSTQPMSDAPPNPTGPERERVHVWGVPDQPGAVSTAIGAVTDTTGPRDTGVLDTLIARPSVPPDAGSTSPDTRTDLPPSRQVLRPDGTILGSADDAPPPPYDTTGYHPSH